MATGELRIAVAGCGHGTLNAIYASIRKTCNIKGWDGVDLAIIGGDFQAVRNASDLNCVSMPPKYREMHDFHHYYSGARTAPYLTIFVGGNHEASNYLSELYYGGWVAPNIYYMGAANVLRVGHLRIAGLSGIWKGYDYKKPHHERLPYNEDDVKSIYHVRELDTRKLLQLRTQVDVGISHDWPRGVEWMGDWKRLFKKKDLFEADARAGQLGSVAAKLVLDRLKPPHWFSAHLHIKYAAMVEDGRNEPRKELTPTTSNGDGFRNGTLPSAGEKVQAPVLNGDGVPSAEKEGVGESSAGDVDESVLARLPAAFRRQTETTVPEELRAQLPAAFRRAPASDRATEEAPLPPPEAITNKVTRFLALDKCLPGRDFLQVLQIQPVMASEGTADERVCLEYDKEWLAITRLFANEFVFGDPSASMPPPQSESYYRGRIEQEEDWVEENVVRSGKLKIPANFEPTAPAYDPALGSKVQGMPREYSNPQTRAFCELLQIPNALHAPEEELERRAQGTPRQRGSGGDRPRGRGSFSGRGSGRGGRGRGRGDGRGRR